MKLLQLLAVGFALLAFSGCGGGNTSELPDGYENADMSETGPVGVGGAGGGEEAASDSNAVAPPPQL